MADISQVKLPNGDTYNLVDETSGYIKSYTDEKVKQIPIEDSNSANYGLIVAYDNGSVETTNSVRSTSRIYISNSTPSIIVGKDTDTQRLSIRPDRISFIYNNGNHQGYLKASSITGSDKTWTLPDETGTIALTSDIPQVYSSTNTGGYLTMATLPIYDGTVE